MHIRHKRSRDRQRQRTSISHLLHRLRLQAGASLRRRREHITLLVGRRIKIPRKHLAQRIAGKRFRLRDDRAQFVFPPCAMNFAMKSMPDWITAPCGTPSRVRSFGFMVVSE